MCTTAPNALSPSAEDSAERCWSSILDTSTLNCSANDATVWLISSSITAASMGSGGNDNAAAQIRRTDAPIGPPASATKRANSLRTSIPALLRLAHRRHVKVWYPQRRHRRPGGPIAPFPRQSHLADTGLGGPAQQVERALVEPKVVDRARHCAVLDQVDAVAGQPGQQQCGRVNLADVPQRRQQQPALGAGDHF